MKNNKRTFSQILNETKTANCETLMHKARTANRIAKRTRGRNRRIAYEVKADALQFLVEKMPNRVSVRRDIKLTEFAVVELLGEQSGLHTPISNLRGIH